MSFNLEQANSGYASVTSAGLAAGTNTGTFKTANTLTFTNNGIFLSKNATDNVAFSSGHAAVSASKACLFGVFINASGNFSTTQGPIVDAGDPCPVPAYPSGAPVTLVGLIKVTTNASTTFTPGTTGLGASGVTAAYSNCMRMPGTAQ